MEVIDTIKIDLNKNPSYETNYKQKGYLTAASLLMHEDCNLACSYCYEKDNHQNKKISNEIITKSLDFLFNNAQMKEDDGFGADAVSVTLFGGEPTLNPEGIYHTLKYGVEKMKETGIGFNCSMITNTTILPDLVKEGIIKFGKDSNFSIQMSVDGPEHVQNSSRIYKNGDGSWDQVIETIPKYMKLDSDGYCNINLHGVLDENNIKYLFESYKYFIDMGIPRLWFIPAHNSNWTMDHVNEYDFQLSLIREYIINELKKGKKIDFLGDYSPLDRCLQNRTSFSKPCGAGDGYCSINHEGVIHACHQFYYYDQGEDGYKLDIGNLSDGVDLDKQRVYIEYGSEDLSCPETCDHYSCYRCIASNYEATGSMFTQIRGLYCKLMKIDQKHQKLLKKEVEKMGLMKTNEGNNENNNCECKFRGSYKKDKKDIEDANLENNETKTCNSEKKDDTITEALEIIIKKIEDNEDRIKKLESNENNPISINLNLGK